MLKSRCAAAAAVSLSRQARRAAEECTPPQCTITLPYVANATRASLVNPELGGLAEHTLKVAKGVPIFGGTGLNSLREVSETLGLLGLRPDSGCECSGLLGEPRSKIPWFWTIGMVHEAPTEWLSSL